MQNIGGAIIGFVLLLAILDAIVRWLWRLCFG